MPSLGVSGIVIGVVILLAAALFAAYKYRRALLRRRRQQQDDMAPVPVVVADAPPPPPPAPPAPPAPAPAAPAPAQMPVPVPMPMQQVAPYQAPFVLPSSGAYAFPPVPMGMAQQPDLFLQGRLLQLQSDAARQLALPAPSASTDKKEVVLDPAMVKAIFKVADEKKRKCGNRHSRRNRHSRLRAVSDEDEDWNAVPSPPSSNRYRLPRQPPIQHPVYTVPAPPQVFAPPPAAASQASLGSPPQQPPVASAPHHPIDNLSNPDWGN